MTNKIRVAIISSNVAVAASPTKFARLDLATVKLLDQPMVGVAVTAHTGD